MPKKSKPSKRAKTDEESANLPVADVQLKPPMPVVSDDIMSPIKPISDEPKQQNDVLLETDANARNDSESVERKKRKKIKKRLLMEDEEILIPRDLKDDGEQQQQQQQEAAAKVVEETARFSLGGKCYAQMSASSGTEKLDIRMYSMDKSSGEMKPKKGMGIAITREQWIKLKSFVKEIDSAFAASSNNHK